MVGRFAVPQFQLTSICTDNQNETESDSPYTDTILAQIIDKHLLKSDLNDDGFMSWEEFVTATEKFKAEKDARDATP